MRVTYKNEKLKRLCKSFKDLQRVYDTKTAKAVLSRLQTMDIAKTLEDIPTVPPESRHKLTGNRDNQWAVSAGNANRIILEPISNNEGIQPRDIIDIKILEISKHYKK